MAALPDPLLEVPARGEADELPPAAGALAVGAVADDATGSVVSPDLACVV